MVGSAAGKMSTNVSTGKFFISERVANREANFDKMGFRDGSNLVNGVWNARMNGLSNQADRYQAY